MGRSAFPMDGSNPFNAAMFDTSGLFVRATKVMDNGA
jgi:hypothetical protein